MRKPHQNFFDKHPKVSRRRMVKIMTLAAASQVIGFLKGTPELSFGSAMARANETSSTDVKKWLKLSRERMEKSPQYRNGQFHNEIARSEDTWNALKKWVTDTKKEKIPTNELATVVRSQSEFDVAPESGFRATWISHSSVLIEIDGKRFLTDPVWGERASPVSFAGPKRFFRAPLALSELPKLDAIILSHDHYDHMCHETIQWLRDTNVPFVTALGVGARLVKMGVQPALVHEHDWWETNDLFGTKLVCTPARHFSGRSLWDQNKTLWTSWCVLGQKQKFFFSGDTAMYTHFKKIGDLYGPFDLVAMETGAYNESWPDVHIGPEQAVQAALDLGTKVFLPVHWATFPLSLHGWTEPAERVLVAAKPHNLKVALPLPGESFEPTLLDKVPVVKWWPEVAWETAEQSPIVSTGLSG